MGRRGNIIGREEIKNDGIMAVESEHAAQGQVLLLVARRPSVGNKQPSKINSLLITNTGSAFTAYYKPLC